MRNLFTKVLIVTLAAGLAFFGAVVTGSALIGVGVAVVFTATCLEAADINL